MDIICITVCVNYSDIFIHMIHHNVQFFKMWYIVTSPDDVDTIDLVKHAHNPNIVLMIYNDFYNNSKFNKGGAVKFAQDYIYNNYVSSNILLLDADIYLPQTFSSALPAQLMPNTLYGTSSRVDYWNLDDFTQNKNPHNYLLGDRFVGFFQLYKQYKIEKSSNILL